MSGSPYMCVEHCPYCPKAPYRKLKTNNGVRYIYRCKMYGCDVGASSHVCQKGDDTLRELARRAKYEARMNELEMP